jgi:8-oxo-dGTP pyrophosphatase MutT (NUDIX family)
MGAARHPTPVAGYQVTGSRRPFTGHVVAVRVDEIVGADGRRGTREVVEHPGAVAALVVDDDGHLVLVEQWRQPLGRPMLEIVAGRYDKAGETVEQALRRELTEELGVTGGQLTWLTTFATTPGWSDELLDLYLVVGAAPLPGGRPERGWEEATLRPVTLTLEEAVARVASLGVGDAKTLVALGLYGLMRSGVWQPGGDPPSATVPARRAAAARPPGTRTGDGVADASGGDAAGGGQG